MTGIPAERGAVLLSAQLALRTTTPRNKMTPLRGFDGKRLPARLVEDRDDDQMPDSGDGGCGLVGRRRTSLQPKVASWR